MLAKTVINSVVSTRRAVVSTDAAHDERFKKSESLVIMRVHSLMAAPLLEGDRCVGILQVDDSRPGLRFSDPDLRLLVAVASMGARAMQHARLLDEQKQIIQDLKHARARLERSDQLAIVGRTATALAHEIKNQLGPLSLLDMLRSRFPDDEEVHESVEMVVEAQRRILSLVQEMRGYAQGDKACVPDHRLPVDVGELVHSVVRFLQFDRECREVPMVVEIHADIIADVDSDRIKQVLVNLIRNGVQALSSTEKEQRRIRVRVGEIGRKKCTIDVIDNGPGIEPDTIGKIFEPFFTTKGMEGTGLGLDISRQIVEAHDGRLVCTSKVGKGTVMRIVLPYEP
jgi:signal transduction histidine kinase